MTQPPERPAEQEPPAGAATPIPPPDPATSPSASEPQPYAAAPPIAEQYGSPAPPGSTGSYASRGRRFLAWLLDSVILSIISGLVSAPFVGVGAMFSNDPDMLGKRLAGNSITAVLGFIYYVWQHGKWGRTIGKRAMDLRVVRADDGGPIGYGTAAWRLVFTYLITIVTLGIGWIVDSLWILFDGRRQALHDKVAKTVVVKPAAGEPDPYAQR
jgi:uncharacterized RDD family membrane protein YckC